MAIKSAYREKPAEQPPDIPASEKIDIEVHDTAVPDVAAIEPAVAVVSADEYPNPDEAGEALKRQLEHLRQSEEAQRQHHAAVMAARAAQMAAPAPTLPEGRAERIALWKQHGLSDDDAAFLQARPSMIDHPQLTRQAVDAAERSGLERGSDDFNIAVENNFATLQGRAEAQATPASTPKFFEPPRQQPVSEPAGPASYVSAPVSRHAPSTGYRVPSSPSQVKLTPEEMQIAAASGISHTEYARHKLRMLKAKASGELQ